MSEASASDRPQVSWVVASHRTKMIDKPERWRSQAECAGLAPDLFFPAGELAGEAAIETVEAKAVCATCRVRLHCLVWALSANVESGIWGGMTARERQQLAKERKARSGPGAARKRPANRSGSRPGTNA